MLGLYLVLWGKNRERRMENQREPFKVPLLDEESIEKQDGEVESDIP